MLLDIIIAAPNAVSSSIFTTPSTPRLIVLVLVDRMFGVWIWAVAAGGDVFVGCLVVRHVIAQRAPT
jgi:hypothetical protein